MIRLIPLICLAVGCSLATDFDRTYRVDPVIAVDAAPMDAAPVVDMGPPDASTGALTERRCREGCQHLQGCMAQLDRPDFQCNPEPDPAVHLGACIDFCLESPQGWEPVFVSECDALLSSDRFISESGTLFCNDWFGCAQICAPDERGETFVGGCLDGPGVEDGCVEYCESLTTETFECIGGSVLAGFLRDTAAGEQPDFIEICVSARECVNEYEP